MSFVGDVIRELRRIDIDLERKDDTWIQTFECEFCLDVHTPKLVHFSELRGSFADGPGVPPINPVRLTDGTNEVRISFGPSCCNQPFTNSVKHLIRNLQLKPLNGFQPFDSMDHLIGSLQFSVSGQFFQWEGPELSAFEAWAEHQGYLRKYQYVSRPESPMMDLSLEISESGEAATEQFGLTVNAAGVQITVDGNDLPELDKCLVEFRSVLDGYALLLSPQVNRTS